MVSSWVRSRLAAANRNTVNQCVACVVFVCLCAYAWKNDMLFRPDPAVPLRGKPPKRGDGIWLYPAQPAFFVAADTAAELEEVLKRDRETSVLVRGLWRRWVHGGGDRKARVVDVGSPYGTVGLHAAGLGAHVVVCDPRAPAAERVGRSLRFSRQRYVHVLRNTLNDQQVLVHANSSHGVTIIGQVSDKERAQWSQGSREVSTTITLAELLGPVPALLVTASLPGAQLGVLRTAADMAGSPGQSGQPAAQRLPAVLLDLARYPSTLESDPKVDLSAVTEAAATADLIQSAAKLRDAGMRLYIVPTHPGAPPCYAAEERWLHRVELLDVTVWGVHESSINSVLAAAVSGAYKRSADADPAPRTCRLLWLRREIAAAPTGQPSLSTSGPLCVVAALVSVFVCVGLRRRRQHSRQK